MLANNNSTYCIFTYIIEEVFNFLTIVQKLNLKSQCFHLHNSQSLTNELDLDFIFELFRFYMFITCHILLTVKLYILFSICLFC